MYLYITKVTCNLVPTYNLTDTYYTEHVVSSQLEMVQVTVSEGTLEGEVVKNELAEFISFKGIPYAAPPVGELRFKVRI